MPDTLDLSLGFVINATRTVDRNISTPVDNFSTPSTIWSYLNHAYDFGVSDNQINFMSYVSGATVDVANGLVIDLQNLPDAMGSPITTAYQLKILLVSVVGDVNYPSAVNSLTLGRPVTNGWAGGFNSTDLVRFSNYHFFHNPFTTVNWIVNASNKFIRLDTFSTNPSTTVNYFIGGLRS